MQDRSALRIRIRWPPKRLARVRIHGAAHRFRCRCNIAARNARIAKNAVPVSVSAVALFHPQRGSVGGPTFVQPNVRPASARDQITGPLMAQLMTNESVKVLLIARGCIQHRRRLHGGGAGVLHAARTEIANHQLVVPRPRILLAKDALKQHHHPIGALIGGLGIIAASLGCPHSHRHSAQRAWQLRVIKVTNDHGNQVRNMWLLLIPMPHFAVATNLMLHQCAVGTCLKSSRNIDHQLGCHADVREVMNREPVMIGLSLPLRVHLCAARGRYARDLWCGHTECQAIQGTIAGIRNHYGARRRLTTARRWHQRLRKSNRKRFAIIGEFSVATINRD